MTAVSEELLAKARTQHGVHQSPGKYEPCAKQHAPNGAWRIECLREV